MGGRTLDFGQEQMGTGGQIINVTSHPMTTTLRLPKEVAKEQGFRTQKNKFLALKNLMLTQPNSTHADFPKEHPKKAYGNLTMGMAANLLKYVDSLGGQVLKAEQAPFAESIGCYYGFIVYRCTLQRAMKTGDVLDVGRFQDRVYAYIDGKYAGLLDRTNATTRLTLRASGDKLVLIVENGGRVNFSPGGMKDTRKGLLTNTIQTKDGWQVVCLDFDRAQPFSTVKWENSSTIALDEGPILYTSAFISQRSAGVSRAALDGVADDTYALMDAPTWGKGSLFVNGFNVGRFWGGMGPQKTLYVPGAKLSATENSVVVLELEPSRNTPILPLISTPILK
mmetsp:Transcript_21961/g.47911  ORF Transcript_21961/g.47911 Transcript_21961/m.47911 type:complete len:337 (-) Transcript_21961:3995-5005(-)